MHGMFLRRSYLFLVFHVAQDSKRLDKVNLWPSKSVEHVSTQEDAMFRLKTHGCTVL
jgi:hypothetical protein